MRNRHRSTISRLAPPSYARACAKDLRAAVKWGFSDEGDPRLAVDLTIASLPLSVQLALLEECQTRVDHALERLALEGAMAGEREMKLYSARGMCLLCHTV